MNRDEQLAHLRLIRTPNIGPMTFSLLIQRYGSAVEALRAVPDLARRGGRDLKPASKSLAEKELAAVEAAGATLLFKGDDGYPDRLARFDDASPVISARSNHITAVIAINCHCGCPQCLNQCDLTGPEIV